MNWYLELDLQILSIFFIDFFLLYSKELLQYGTDYYQLNGIRYQYMVFEQYRNDMSYGTGTVTVPTIQQYWDNVVQCWNVHWIAPNQLVNTITR